MYVCLVGHNFFFKCISALVVFVNGPKKKKLTATFVLCLCTFLKILFIVVPSDLASQMVLLIIPHPGKCVCCVSVRIHRIQILQNLKR
jgi:hypothetical protein